VRPAKLIVRRPGLLGHDGRVTVKHATASSFVFGLHPDGWRIALIMHPLFGRLMLPGGHVESWENTQEAAVREVCEESGLRVQLASPLAPSLPAGLPGLRRRVEPPWWVLEQPVPSDNHLAEPHVHVDHLYVAVAGSTDPECTPAHPLSWHQAAELAGLDMFDDTRLLAAVLFADIGQVAGAAAGAS
jgi:8-oxo-dGTP pyrophosphatase MutT (NUDIX family)